jgi:hypothetical protein
VVLITLGAQGVLVTKKDTISYIPVIEVVVVVDTTGTGGAFSIGVIGSKRLIWVMQWLLPITAILADRAGCETRYRFRLGY